jgi:hypothetical protein
LGDFDQSVDMWELNNERQAANKTTPPTPPARRGGN